MSKIQVTCTIVVYAVISVFRIKFVTINVPRTKIQSNCRLGLRFYAVRSQFCITPGGFPYESGVDDRPVP